MDDLRHQLLAAAGTLLDAEGLEAVTIREVARQCGVSHGAPRRYFPTRTVLLGHLAKRIAGELAEELTGAPQELARGYVAFAQNRPHAFDLLQRHDLLAGSGAELRSATLALVERWRAAWLVDHPGDTAADALARLVAVHGIAAFVAHRAHEVIGLEPVPLIDLVLAKA